MEGNLTPPNPSTPTVIEHKVNPEADWIGTKTIVADSAIGTVPVYTTPDNPRFVFTQTRGVTNITTSLSSWFYTGSGQPDEWSQPAGMATGTFLANTEYRYAQSSMTMRGEPDHPEVCNTVDSVLPATLPYGTDAGEIRVSMIGFAEGTYQVNAQILTRGFTGGDASATVGISIKDSNGTGVASHNISVNTDGPQKDFHFLDTIQSIVAVSGTGNDDSLVFVWTPSLRITLDYDDPNDPYDNGLPVDTGEFINISGLVAITSVARVSSP